MEQDQHTCPSCGAPTPDHSNCPYCGWTSERASNPTTPESAARGETQETIDFENPGAQIAQTEDGEPAHFRDLLKQGDNPEHLLEQVPEEMRGVLAARLKAIDEAETPGFSANTASALREQGYVVSEDARGARFSAAGGQGSELSPSDVVKMASELDDGVQERTKLPICGECQAASPIGETQCQWCGQPFSEDQ
ncbi:MAG: hypothetical protein ACE5JF_09805 [Anaerolineales bacterium]